MRNSINNRIFSFLSMCVCVECINRSIVNSKGTFQFVAAGPDTYCKETIFYQCPPFMGSICKSEVEYQRKAIMANLSSHRFLSDTKSF